MFLLSEEELDKNLNKDTTIKDNSNEENLKEDEFEDTMFTI